MSLIYNDVKNDIHKINSFNNNHFTKEMLQELLQRSLNQRLNKLESSNKEQTSNLNYTSKYFKEFSKAINQFSKFLEESLLIKEKEREIIEKKENIETNNNPLKITSKKSNESSGSANLQKNNKMKQNNKKLENSLRIRSNTQALFKSQQFKKQSNNILIAKTLFSSRNNEEKKIKSKQNIIISPDKEKNNKSTGRNDTPQKVQKTGYFLERNTINFKVPKTEKRAKTKNLKNKDRNSIKFNNISENKFENEQYFTEKDNINNSKYLTSLKKSYQNSKSNIKNKKEIALNLHNSIKSNNNEFSKTMKNKFINKTLDIDDNEKINMKSSFSTKKKRKLKLNGSGSNNINDIKDIVKLVDNVNQNIAKLLESNDILNNNKSLMMTSLELTHSNKIDEESNFRSSKNLLDNDDISNIIEKKSLKLKKKKVNPNIALFKDIDDKKNDNIRQNILNEENKENKESPSYKYILRRKSKNFEDNKRYQSKENSLVLEMNKIKNKIEIENEKKIIKNIDVIEIFKKDKKILRNIVSYLKDIEIILFASSNNYLNKERIAILDN